MLNFIYSENATAYSEIENRPLRDCICKHVMCLKSEKSKAVYEESVRIGYKQVMWGFGSGIWKNPDQNRIIQMQCIRRMLYKKYNGPYRIVIDKAGEPFVDNLHTAIRELILYGGDVKIKDTKHYMVDTRTNPYTIVNVDGTVRQNFPDIAGCLKVSNDRLSRITPKLKSINYTIFEFMHDNNITKEKLITW